MMWTIELWDSGMPQPLRRKVRGFSRFANREIAFIPRVIGPAFPRRTPNPTLVLLSSSYILSAVVSEIMAFRFLHTVVLSICFSMVAYAAAPPVNLALDQPGEGNDTA